MVISAIEQVSPGCEKITAADGPAFFIRTAYLRRVKEADIQPGTELTGEYEQDLLDAGLCYAAEAKAVDYLARAEQSRFGLTRKLGAKGMEKHYIECALDYLESVGYLSDARYAGAWLNSRKSSHFDGRARLAAELAARGIERHTAAQCIDEFLRDNPEEEQCRKAVEKCMRRGMDRDKMANYLAMHGFAAKMIQKSIDFLNHLDD